jgi:hypothetical protein
MIPKAGHGWNIFTTMDNAQALICVAGALFRFGRCRWLQQSAQILADRIGETHHGHQHRVQLAAFDLREVGLTDIGLGGQLLLRQAGSEPGKPQILAEQNLHGLTGVADRAGSWCTYAPTLAAGRLLWHLRIAFPQYACVIAVFFAAGNRRLRFLVSKKPSDFSWTFTFSQAWRGNPVRWLSRQALLDERPKLTADGSSDGRHGSQPRIASAGFDGVQAHPWKATHGCDII